MKTIIISFIFFSSYCLSQNCTADDGTNGIELWGTCYSIQNTDNLYLSNSGLTGEIPPEIGELINLQRLYIDNNQLTGSIPLEVSNLTNLIFLKFNDNRLTGSIPDEVCNLNINWNGTSYFNLTNNQFCPPYPSCITNQLVFPQECDIYECSEDNVGLWGWCYNIEETTNLDARNNEFTGSIPLEIGELTNLEYLDLNTNQFTGEIPTTISNLINLKTLDLSYNQLSEDIPTWISNLSSLERLKLHDNQFSGNIPPEIANLTYLIELTLENNEFTGSIPLEIGELTNLEYLDLNTNQFTGEIPTTISNLTNLNTLRLHNNNLTGDIPEDFCNSNIFNGGFLTIRNNNFCPPYPSCLNDLEYYVVPQECENAICGDNDVHLWGWCYDIQTTTDINMFSRGITGLIPDEIGNLANLERLSLTQNDLTGEIPSEIGNLTNLVELYLGENHLSGEIPPEIGSLENLSSLVLSNNQLIGNIPESFSNLINLSGGGSDWNFLFGPKPGLVLSNNQLSGEIPSWINELINLGDLDLSFNNFSGEIPSEIGELTSLTNLSLNNNQLSGEIPESFRSLDNLQDIIFGLAPSVSYIPGLNLSNNLLSGYIPFEICSLNIIWTGNNFYGENIGSNSFGNNSFCPPYPECLNNNVGVQDSSNCESILNVVNQFLPNKFQTYNAYPNPFNPITSLRYELPEESLVNITIYDMMGRIVRSLINTPQTAGFKSIQWNAKNDQGQQVSAGVYLYKIQVGKFRETKKIVLLK